MPDRESHPPAIPSLSKKAAAHPEYQKWMQAAGEAEAVNPEDAMEHAEDTADNPVYMTAKLYWLRRSLGEDDKGFDDVGEHERKVQEFVDRFKVSRAEAEDMMNVAHAEVAAEQALLLRRRLDIYVVRQEAQKEIAKIQERLRRIAA